MAGRTVLVGDLWQFRDPELRELFEHSYALCMHDRVIVRGASLVRVYLPAGSRIEGHDEGRAAIVVAWARLGDGRDWGALLAWAGNWRGANHRPTVRPRWGWVRLDAERVKPDKSRTVRPGSEIQWFGSWSGCAMEEAMYHAAIELPKDQREAAVTPRPWVEG